MTMTTMKTLMLAGFAAVSLGTSAAMAQEGGPSMPTVGYWAAKEIHAEQLQAQAAKANQIQSGASDVDTMRFGVSGRGTSRTDFTTLANPG
jgi:hypothetical protein